MQIVYDGDGHKVREVVNGNTISYLVDEQNPTGYAQVVEEKQNGVVLRTYTYGHDLLAQDERDGGGSWSATYFGYDGHGNVRLLTDATGHITDTYVYDAFGIALETTGSTFNRYRYSGEAYDSPLGLQYLRARLLDSRFTLWLPVPPRASRQTTFKRRPLPTTAAPLEPSAPGPRLLQIATVSAVPLLL